MVYSASSRTTFLVSESKVALAPPPPSKRGGYGGGEEDAAFSRITDHYIDDGNTSFILYPASFVLFAVLTCRDNAFCRVYLPAPYPLPSS